MGTFHVLMTIEKKERNLHDKKSIPTHASPLHHNRTIFSVHFESSFPPKGIIAVYAVYDPKFPIPIPIPDPVFLRPGKNESRHSIRLFHTRV